MTSYGEKHEYVKIKGKKHYVIHPSKPHHSIKHHHHSHPLRARSPRLHKLRPVSVRKLYKSL